MEPNSDNNYLRVKKSILLIAVVILIAGIAGWLIGRGGDDDKNSNSQNTTQSTSNDTNKNDDKTAGTKDVKSLVTYKLPDGWKETSCPNSEGTVYVIPVDSPDADCNSNPSTPVKLSVDPGNHKDCNELQGEQDIKKHVCVSVFINGYKTLKSSTEYLASSSYKRETTVNYYYMDTGKGVVKAEYIFNTDNEFQAGFDELTNSLQVKR